MGYSKVACACAGRTLQPQGQGLRFGLIENGQGLDPVGLTRWPTPNQRNSRCAIYGLVWSLILIGALNIGLIYFFTTTIWAGLVLATHSPVLKMQHI